MKFEIPSVRLPRAYTRDDKFHKMGHPWATRQLASQGQLA